MKTTKRIFAAMLAAILFLSNIEPLYIHAAEIEESTVSTEQIPETTAEQETMSPTVEETTQPVVETTSPTVEETTAPTVAETTSPTVAETTAPTVAETTSPTVAETTSPTVAETTSPTVEETTSPTVEETTEPTVPETTAETLSPEEIQLAEAVAELETAIAGLPQGAEPLDKEGYAALKEAISQVDALLVSLAEEGTEPLSLLSEEARAIYQERCQFLAGQREALCAGMLGELETAIGALPAAEELMAQLEEGTLDENGYLALKAQFEETEVILADLSALTEEDALSLLSPDAQTHYMEIQGILAMLAEMKTLEGDPWTEDVQTIIDAIHSLPTLAEGETRLAKADYITLQTELVEIDQKLKDLEKYKDPNATGEFDPWMLFDDPAVKTAYLNYKDILNLGPREPDLSLLPGLEETVYNGEKGELTFIWNDKQNDTHPKTVLGIGLPGEHGLHAQAVAYVSDGGGEPRAVSLYDLYKEILSGYGYDDTVIENFVKNNLMPLENSGEHVQGQYTSLTWDMGKLLTAYKDKNGVSHTVEYRLEPKTERVAGGSHTYLVNQKQTKIGTDPETEDPIFDTDHKTVLATPTQTFSYSVVWYDNKNNYVDEKGENPRPVMQEMGNGVYTSAQYFESIELGENGKEVDGHLQLIRIEDGDTSKGDLLESKDFNPQFKLSQTPPNDMAEQWDVQLSELPMYGPNGEVYKYWARQTNRENDNRLYTTLSTGAYYEQEIVTTDLLNPLFPNAIPENATVYNILSREGHFTFEKTWADTADSANRPKTTFHFYREVETEVLGTDGNGNRTATFEGAPLAGYDKVTVAPGDELPKEGVASFSGTKDVFTVTVPGDKTTLPMFDAYGHRYIYYCIETMEGQGDYEAVIDNDNGNTAGPIVLPDNDLALVRDSGEKAGVILSGAKVTNQLIKEIEIPVEVDFKAQAIQNNMGTVNVDLQLQRWNSTTNTWEDYRHTRKNEDGTDHVYDGTLNLHDFDPEIMSMTGVSEPVPKYNEATGEIYQYRWVQTSISYGGGTGNVPIQPDPEDPNDPTVRVADKVKLQGPNGEDVGPGVVNKDGVDQKTALFFRVDSTNPSKPETQVITNTLIGNTRVRADKTWTVAVDGVTYSTNPDTAKGEIQWDGSRADLERLVGADAAAALGIAKWPKETNLTFNVLRDGKQLYENGAPVTVTMPAGQFFIRKDDLSRYDENGNEYSYSLGEGTTGNWFTTWQHTTDVVARENDGVKVLRKTTAFVNVIGPGPLLVFDAAKYWEDDTDLETRKEVTVGVFRISDGKEMGRATLNLENNWFAQIVIDKADDDDTVENYVVKEISVGGVDAQYEGSDKELQTKAYDFGELLTPNVDYFEAHRDDPVETYFTPHIAGTLAMNDTDTEGKLKFQYNVYLSARDNGTDHAYYDIYNQRTAVLNVKVTKTWVNDTQKSSAVFDVYRGRSGSFSYYDTKTLDNYSATPDADGKTEVTDAFENLPKYDATGVLYEYQVKEVKMSVLDGVLTEIDLDKNIVDVSGPNPGDRTYRYTCEVEAETPELAQNKWEDDGKKTPSPHHSGDVYPWTATNTRKNTYNITVYKIWRDGAGPNNDQDKATRPDISFHVYRISHADLKKKLLASGIKEENLPVHAADALKKLIETAGNASITAEDNARNYTERVNGNYFWTTSKEDTGTDDERGHNLWYWRCDVLQNVDLYDKNGSPYIYFAFEYMMGNAYGYNEYYENNPTHVDGNVDGPINPKAGTTKDTFDHILHDNNQFLLILDGEYANDYYPCVVVNARERVADVKGEKTWEFGRANLQLGSTIHYEDLPNVTLRLWRAVATMVADNGSDTPAASADTPAPAANDIKYKFQPAEWKNAVEIDSVVLGKNGVTNANKEYKYSFPSETYKMAHPGVETFPRYDEYGYRYSYWITEEPVNGYEGDNMAKPGLSPDGKPNLSDNFGTGKRGEFNVTNKYKGEPPNVEITLKKEWKWPDGLPDEKKKLTVTFELHGYITERTVDGETVKVGDETFVIREQTFQWDASGKMTPETLTFEKANTGGFNGAKLPYYSPGGTPYQWYIKEIYKDEKGNPAEEFGYEVTSEITMDEKHPESGGVTTALTNFFSGLTGRAADQDATVSNPTEAILPELGTGTNSNLAKAEVTFTNKYVGNPRSLNVQKNWEDDSLTALRKEVKVKLYRQWDIGNGQTAWEQVTKADEKNADNSDALGWNQMDADGVLTLKKESGWKLAKKETDDTLKDAPLTNLYQYAPSGKAYQYFVVEQTGTGQENLDNWYNASTSTDKHPDVASAASVVDNTVMTKQSKYSNNVKLLDGETQAATATLTNTLLTKKLSVTKDWQKELGDGTTPHLSKAEAEDMKKLGILPDTVHFFVQYKLEGGTDWKWMPASTANFEKTPLLGAVDNTTDVTALGGYLHKSISIDVFINANMKKTETFENLPAYYKDRGGNQVKVSYRWVEVMEKDSKLTVCDPVTEKADGDIHVTPGTATETDTGQKPVVANITQTFTNTIPVKSLVLRKVWVNDNANRDDTRPEKITITVKRKNDATDPGFNVELTVKQLVADSNGDIYESSVHYVPSALIPDVTDVKLVATEIDCPPGYKQVKSETDPTDVTDPYSLPFDKRTDADGKDTYFFTATNKLKENTDRVKIDLAATKTWNESGVDGSWMDITRPTVKFRLEYRYQNIDGSMTEWATANKDATGIEEAAATQTLGKSNKVTWDNVNKYHTEDGTAVAKEIEYRIVEIMTNASGTPLTTQPYTPAGNGIAEFTRDEDADGKKTASIQNTLKTVQPSVTKRWNDKAGGVLTAAQIEKLIGAGVLPSHIRFALYYQRGNGGWQPYETGNPAQPYTLDLSVKDDLLNDKFEPVEYKIADKKFPQFDKNGNTISYELREAGVYFGGKTVANYQVTASGKVGPFTVKEDRDANNAAHTNVTNTVQLESLTVKKTWKDMDNRDGLRKDITVELWRDGAVYDTETLSDPNWTYTWSGLPIYQNGSATAKSAYEVKETTALPDYTKTPGPASVTLPHNLAVELVNTHDPVKLDISAEKQWEDLGDFYGLRPQSVKLLLEYQDGTEWKAVPQNPNGFTGQTGVSFRNVTGGILNYDGTVTVKGTGDSWGPVVWHDLPEKSGGTEVRYRVREVDIPTGYECVPAEVTAGSATVTVTNSLTTTSVTVEKKWDDHGNRYATRPDSLTFRLQSCIPGEPWEDVTDENGVRTAVMTAPWNPVTFDNLLARDKDGHILLYRVVEECPAGYTAPEFAEPEQGKASVTNTLETVDLTVKKLWEDESDHYGTRPDDLKLTVSYRAENGKQISLSPQPDFTWVKQGDTWTAKLTGLPKYIPGGADLAEYTVTETQPTGYRAAAKAVKVDEQGRAELKNVLATVQLSGSKTWDDAENQDGIRPKTITVRLYADGKVLPDHVAVVGGEQSWRWTFRNLPKYHDDGTEVVYTVAEDPVEGYTAKVSGMDIVNTHIPGKLSIPVKKSWKDWMDLDKLRPKAVTIHLLADGADTGKTLTLKEENGWKGSFDGLDEFREGKRIVYTLTEDPVEKYESTIQGSIEEGFTVINRHRPAILDRLPKTGDDSRLGLYGAGLLVSAGGLIWLLRRRGKSRKRKEI